MLSVLAAFRGFRGLVFRSKSSAQFRSFVSRVRLLAPASQEATFLQVPYV